MLFKVLFVCTVVIVISAEEATKPPTTDIESKLNTMRAMEVCQKPDYIERKWGSDLPQLHSFRIFYEGLCMSDEMGSLFNEKDGRLDVGIIRSDTPAEIKAVMANCAKRVGFSPAETLRMFASCFLGNEMVIQNFEKVAKTTLPTILIL